MSAQPQYKPKLVFGALVSGEEVHINATDAKGTTPVSTTTGVGATGNHYIAIPCEESKVAAVFIAWTGTTNSTAASNAIEATNIGNQFAKLTDETDDWADEPAISVTGPNGSAGSEIIHVVNTGARRLRLKLVISAAGEIRVWAWGKD